MKISFMGFFAIVLLASLDTQAQQDQISFPEHLTRQQLASLPQPNELSWHEDPGFFCVTNSRDPKVIHSVDGGFMIDQRAAIWNCYDPDSGELYQKNLTALGAAEFVCAQEKSAEKDVACKEVDRLKSKGLEVTGLVQPILISEIKRKLQAGPRLPTSVSSLDQRMNDR